MADVLTSEQRHKCMSRIRSRNTKSEIVHLFLENFAVRHAIPYGESGGELNQIAGEDKTEHEKNRPL